ncbi:YceD family protein [Clostridium sp. FAM 1755]|uniref:YceD family protein n=1 Tax=Clostridium sporogenes TaxID=1509 RepID=A0AAE4FH72_CLOSG|nr:MULTISPECIES: YceD family protein [Clostridium]KOR26889.1 DNA-binding protein [Clostridium sp. L74]MDS1002234.1 YceD family protein [Clostridium sporogenes]NFV11363.1 DUF177 domain-containing protein [Clostridium sporogenes]
MNLDVSDLIKKIKVSKEIHLKLEDDKKFFDGEEEILYLEAPTLDGVVNVSEDILTLDGKLSAEIELSCSRCLQKFKHHVDTEVHESFTNNPQCEDDEIMLLKNEAIDVTEVIENNIIIELPIKRLCKENCKGLCQQCGANFNFSKCKCEKDIDPRLAKLKDFFSAQ